MRYCVTINIELDIDVLFFAADASGRAIRAALDQPLTAQVRPEWAVSSVMELDTQHIAVPATTMPCTTSPAATMEG